MILADYAAALRRAINVPGVDNFSDATNVELTAYLEDAFAWAKLDGFIPKEFKVISGEVVSTVDPLTEFPDELITLVLLYAKISILRMQILNVKSKFSAKAGPTEFTVEQNTSHLRDLLKTFEDQLDDLAERLIEPTGARSSRYIDVTAGRSYGGICYDW